MTGFEPAVSCLGSRRATTAPHPHGRAFFRIRRTAVTYSPPAERGMAGLRVGLTGFEPATPCSQSTCATKLRHNPLHRYESRTAHHCFLGRFELRLWFPINVSEPLFHPALPVVADAIFLSADRWLYTLRETACWALSFTRPSSLSYLPVLAFRQADGMHSISCVAPGGFEPPTMHAPPFELRSRPERVVS